MKSLNFFRSMKFILSLVVFLVEGFVLFIQRNDRGRENENHIVFKVKTKHITFIHV